VPLSPDRLGAALAQELLRAAAPGRPLRIIVDGPRSAAVESLADALVAPMRAAGRPTVRVRADDFWRDASVRLEHGRMDAESYYSGWADLAALRREVLEPLGADGDMRVLPSLRDPDTNRATRAAKLDCASNTALILDGDLLLGAGLPADAEVHIAQSAAARARRIPPEWAWTLPVYERYDDEVGPGELADAVVRMDDPARPAVRVRPGRMSG
jgi:hypothetical protein